MSKSFTTSSFSGGGAKTSSFIKTKHLRRNITLESIPNKQLKLTHPHLSTSNTLPNVNYSLPCVEQLQIRQRHGNQHFKDVRHIFGSNSLFCQTVTYQALLSGAHHHDLGVRLQLQSAQLHLIFCRFTWKEQGASRRKKMMN